LGVSILAARNAKRAAEGGLHLDRSVVELARNKALDELQAFTIEATITPEEIAGDRRNILEPGGKLVGSVHTSTSCSHRPTCRSPTAACAPATSAARSSPRFRTATRATWCRACTCCRRAPRSRGASAAPARQVQLQHHDAR
jgi:hypothetical protein